MAVGCKMLVEFSPVAGDHEKTVAKLEAVDWKTSGWLMTMLVSLPAKTCTAGTTLTNTVDVPALGQPNVSYTLNVKVVVSFG